MIGKALYVEVYAREAGIQQDRWMATKIMYHLVRYVTEDRVSTPHGTEFPVSWAILQRDLTESEFVELISFELDAARLVNAGAKPEECTFYGGKLNGIPLSYEN